MMRPARREDFGELSRAARGAKGEEPGARIQDSGSDTATLFFPAPGSRLPTPLRHSAILLVAAVVAGCLPLRTSGQEYKTAPINDRLRLDGLFAQNYVKAPTGSPADKQRFDAYFSEYYFPAMTRYEPTDLAELGDLRYDLFRRYIWVAPNEQFQRDLTDMAFQAMLAIVGDPDYHPAVRYNAVLVLGMLDEEYAVDVGANRRPPKPLAKANEILIKAAGADKIPPPLLVGALIGLERHAKYRDSLSPEAVSGMTAAALKIVNMEQPPPDVDREVFAWIQLKAANVLAQLGSVGQGDEVHQALMKLVADKKLSLEDRCRVAGILRNINYEGVKLSDPSSVEPLVELAVEVGQAEAKRAREFEQLYTNPGGTSATRSRRESRGGYDEEKEYERRELLSLLVNLRRGLTAVKPALAGQQLAQVDAILAAIRPVISAVADEDTVDLAVTVKVRTMQDEIREAARTEAPPTEDEPPADGS